MNLADVLVEADLPPQKDFTMKTLLATTTALVALVAGAQAADLGAPRLPIAGAIAAPGNWTGFYLGAQVGTGWLTGSSSIVGEGISWGGRSNGVLGGLHAGYNHQINNVVFGVEVDGEISALRSGNSGILGVEARFDGRWQSSLRGRLGVAADKALFYVTGGLAFGQFNFATGELGGPLQSYRVNRTGWTVGAGVEYAFAPNWTGRVEYRYADFGTVTADLAPFFPGTLQRTTLQSHTVRLGVSYLFSTGPR